MKGDLELHKKLGDLSKQLDQQKEEISQIKSLLISTSSKPKKARAPKSEGKKGSEGKISEETSVKKRGRPRKAKPEDEEGAEAEAEAAQEKAMRKTHKDSSLRMRDRFYYATFQAPPGTLDDEPDALHQLLVSNFNRLCGRNSYQIHSAGCTFEEETFTLHCILRGGVSLPTTSDALGNCNPTSITKEKGKPVEYYGKGIKLTPLNRGKGGYITSQILDSVLNFILSFGPIEGCGGKEFDVAVLADGVPDESEIDPAHRLSFDPETRQMVGQE